MEALFSVIFITNSFTPRPKKTKSLYHLALLLARELFIKVQGSWLSGFWLLATGCLLLVAGQQREASGQNAEPTTLETGNTEPLNLKLYTNLLFEEEPYDEQKSSGRR